MAESTSETRAVEKPRPKRSWSVYIGRVTGIPIYLHFTFILLLVGVAYFEYVLGQPIFGGLLFVICIFASVGLHELGHAMVARSFKIQTDDIVLYPIGGVARLRSMGKGLQEFWIALAGPAVNLVIAIALWLILSSIGKWVPIDQITQEMQQLAQQAQQQGGQAAPQTEQLAEILPGFWQRVAFVNWILLGFNLIPAFPMDGGRVLRSLLTQVMPREQATTIAAKIGQFLAVVFLILGFLSGNVILMFIGVFIFMAAGQESQMMRTVALLEGKKVGEAMITHFDTLQHGDTLGKAAELLLNTSQSEFPVMGGGEVIGVLERKPLIQGLAEHGRDHYVAEVMSREFQRFGPDDDLEKAFEGIMKSGGKPVLVFDGDELVGFINQENIAEYLMITQSRQRQQEAEESA